MTQHADKLNERPMSNKASQIISYKLNKNIPNRKYQQ